MVKAPTVSSSQEYVAALHEAGFVDVETEDMSTPWQVSAFGFSRGSRELVWDI